MDFSSIWVLGLSGAGKTSLVNGLKSIVHCDTLNIGEILRSTYASRRILDADIPECEIFSIISNQLTKNTTNLVIVDNYPLNRYQLDIWIKCYPLPILVFFLDMEDTKERKKSRGRLDDTDIGYMRRKLQFENDTVPVIDYMKERNIVFELDANRTKRELVADAFKIIQRTFIKSNIDFNDRGILTVERHSELARIPTKSSPFSTAYDIYLTKAVIIRPHKTVVHSVSISVEIRARSVGVILSHSSIASRGILIHSGIIDPDAEDLKITISNLTDDTLLLDNQNAVAQIIILPTYCPRVVETSDGFN